MRCKHANDTAASAAHDGTMRHNPFSVVAKQENAESLVRRHCVPCFPSASDLGQERTWVSAGQEHTY